jgi:uncharacterized protein (DUF2141 family)
MRGMLKLGLMCLAAALPAAAHAGDVEVRLEGLRAGGGTLFVGVQTRDEFLGPAQNGETTVAPAEGGATTVTLRNVAPGDYAVLAWHDDNKNGQFDTDGPDRPPLDGWAIANFGNPSGPPMFDQVKVTVGTDTTKVSTPMTYSR